MRQGQCHIAHTAARGCSGPAGAPYRGSVAGRSLAAGILVTAALLLPVAPALPALAHPNASSTPLRPGEPATVAVLLFADEGDTRGYAITVPAGVRLDGASGDRLLPQVTRTGATATFRGGLVTPGQFVQVHLQVVPSTTGRLMLDIEAELDAGRAPYRYPPVVVGDVESAAGVSRGSVVALALLAAGGLLAAVRLRRRRARRASVG